jgi:deoxyadenosine/deoxycytidine kinase
MKRSPQYTFASTHHMTTEPQNHKIIFPNFITIEGNIGAGKTTLATRLAEDRNSRLILEAFSDNPFLPPFYAEPEHYAFPVELFFMAERHKQLQAELAQTDLFSSGVIADYLFIKTLLFARNTLPAEEFRLFSRLFKVMDAGFPNPDLIVFLDRPVEALQANIAKRGRDYEREMKDDYLASVRAAYFNYFGTQKEVPVLVLELGELNFAEDEAVYARMIALMEKPYSVGVTTVKL